MNNIIFRRIPIVDTVRMRNTTLISRRKQLKLKQKDVAKRAGIALTTYQRFEDGSRDFTHSSASTYLAVCSALGLDPYEFFKDDINLGKGENHGT